jgi:DHA1 family bicyclomycin/chloramphenicol resistance-like MFS transporter
MRRIPPLLTGALLTALVALGQISTSIYIPSLPSLVRALDASPAEVNLTLSLFLAGFAVGQLVFGPVSDRLGRRPALLAGLGLYTLASLACAFAASIDALILGRLTQGLAASAGPVLGRAVVRDLYGAERSAAAMGYIGAAFSISPAISPMVGGYLQVWFGWRAAFFCLTGIGAAILAAAWRLMHETRPRAAAGPAGGRAFVAACLGLARDRRFWAYTSAVGFTFGALMAFTAAGPFVFIDTFGVTPDRFGLLYVFPVAGFFAGSLVAGRLAARTGLDRTLRIGLVLGVLGGGIMIGLTAAGHASVEGILAPMAVFSAGLGLVMATGIAGALAAFPQVAGAASALLGFVQMGLGGLASVAAGLTPHASPLPMAAVVTTFAAAGLLAFAGLARRAPGG